ncbi:hypothetical protein ONZ43_g3281 [Nemania bipapillata]|uniref:Uncharacterized protein n=1 Tax=Nemania bipapillata TaxID=110536 RepID=A0ACC2IXE8_9PEZI|nr:hypothetical protein ONZ43_g3281 [Nemania bipapillata]
MPLELREVDTAVDFPALAKCLYESYEDPLQQFFYVWFPIFGDTKWHAEDPSSYWQKIVDTETGKIAGAALRNIHKENPFTEEHDMEITWFPDDDLFIIYTSPEYRRKGVAQKFMDWGMKKADEMGVEMFLDSTPVGKPLYEANQFITVKDNLMIPQMDSPDEAWEKLERQTGPVTFYLMWRPVGGKYEEGKTVFPWEK